MAEDRLRPPDPAPTSGSANLGEIKEKIKLEMKDTLENLKKFLKSLKDIKEPLKNFQKVTGEAEKTFGKLKKSFAGRDGLIEQFKGLAKIFKAWIKDLDLFKKVAPTFDKLKGSLKGVGESLKTTRDSFAGVARTAKGMDDVTAATARATTAVGKMTGATEKATKAAKGMGTMWKLVGSTIAVLTVGPLANLSLFLADKLTPDLSHVTGTVEKQSDAMLSMQAHVKSLAQAFEKGNKVFGGLFRREMEKASAAIVDKLNPALVETVGLMSGAASVGLSFAGAALKIASPLIQVGGAIGAINLLLKAEWMKKYTKDLKIAGTAVKSTSSLLKIFGKLAVAGAKQSVMDMKDALKFMGTAAKGATKYVAGLSKVLAKNPVALAVTAALAVVSLIGVRKAMASTTVEAKKNLTAMEKLRLVNKELADSLDAQFKSLRRQAEALKLQRLQLAGDPIAQVFDVKIQGRAELEDLHNRFKEFKDFLTKNANIPKELTKQLQEHVKVWEDLLTIDTKRKNQISEVLAVMRMEIELADRLYQKKQGLLNLERERIQIERNNRQLAQDAGLSPRRAWQARALDIQSQIEERQVDLEEGKLELKSLAKRKFHLGHARSQISQVAKLIEHGGVKAEEAKETTLKRLNRRVKELEADSASRREDQERFHTVGWVGIDHREKKIAENALEINQHKATIEILEQEEADSEFVAKLRNTVKLKEEEVERATKSAEQRVKGIEKTITTLEGTYQKATSEESKRERHINKRVELLQREQSILSEIASLQQSITQQEIAQVAERLKLTDLTQKERSDLEKKQGELQARAIQETLDAETKAEESHKKRVKLINDEIANVEAQKRKAVNPDEEEEYEKRLKELEAAKDVLKKTAEQHKLDKAARRDDTQSRKEAIELAEQKKELELNTLSIEQEQQQAKLENLQQEEQLHGTTLKRQREQKKIQIEILNLEKEKLKVQRDQYAQKIKELEVDLTSQEQALQDLEAEKAKQSQQGADTALIDVSIADKRNEIARTNIEINRLKQGVEQTGVQIKRTTNNIQNMNTALERVGQIEIDLSTPFQVAMDQAYSVVVHGTGKMKDVFKNLKSNIILTFKEALRQNIADKLSFDKIFAKNFLVDLVNIVKTAAGRIGGILSSVFKGNFSGAGSQITSIFSGGTPAAGGGSGGGGGSLLSTAGNITSLGNAGSSLLQGNSLFKSGGLVSSGLQFLDKIGGNAIGRLVGAPITSITYVPGQGVQATQGFFGPLANLSAGTQLLSAGAGIAGSIGGNALLSAFNFKGGIGSTVGGLAGGLGGAALGTAILPGIGTILGALGGSFLGTTIGGLFGGQYTRIAVEKKGIEKYLQAVLEQVYGVEKFDVPRRSTQKFLPGAEAKFGDYRDALSILGLGYTLDTKKGGIGTVKRFGNLALAGFQNEDLTKLEALEGVRGLGAADDFSLLGGLEDLNKALRGGFDHKDNRLTLREYNEEIEEEQRWIIRYTDLIKGAIELGTNFSSTINAQAIALRVAGDQFAETAKKTDLYNDSVKDLETQIKEGNLGFEEAVNKLNELRTEAGKSRLELKDFALDTDKLRIFFLRLGISADETASKFLEIGDQLNQLDQQSEQLTNTLNQLDDQIHQLRLENTYPELQVERAVQAINPPTEIDDVLADRQQYIDTVILPQLFNFFRHRDVDIDIPALTLSARNPRDVHTIIRGVEGNYVRNLIEGIEADRPLQSRLSDRYGVDLTQGRSWVFGPDGTPSLEEGGHGFQRYVAPNGETQYTWSGIPIDRNQARQFEGFLAHRQVGTKELRDALLPAIKGEEIQDLSVTELQALKSEAVALQEYIIENFRLRLQKGLEDIAERLEEQAEKIREESERTLENLNRQLSVSQAMKDLGENLKQTLKDLGTGPQSPLSQTLRFDFAKRDVERLKARLNQDAEEEAGTPVLSRGGTDLSKGWSWVFPEGGGAPTFEKGAKGFQQVIEDGKEEFYFAGKHLTAEEAKQYLDKLPSKDDRKKIEARARDRYGDQEEARLRKEAEERIRQSTDYVAALTRQLSQIPHERGSDEYKRIWEEINRELEKIRDDALKEGSKIERLTEQIRDHTRETNDKLEDLQDSFEDEEKKLRAALGAELGVLLTPLQDLQTAINETLIGKLEEEKKIVENQLKALDKLKDGLVGEGASLLNLTRDVVIKLLDDIRNGRTGELSDVEGAEVLFGTDKNLGEGWSWVFHEDGPPTFEKGPKGLQRIKGEDGEWQYYYGGVRISDEEAKDYTKRLNEAHSADERAKIEAEAREKNRREEQTLADELGIDLKQGYSWVRRDGEWHFEKGAGGLQLVVDPKTGEKQFYWKEKPITEEEADELIALLPSEEERSTKEAGAREKYAAEQKQKEKDKDVQEKLKAGYSWVKRDGKWYFEPGAGGLQVLDGEFYQAGEKISKKEGELIADTLPSERERAKREAAARARTETTETPDSPAPKKPPPTKEEQEAAKEKLRKEEEAKRKKEEEEKKKEEEEKKAPPAGSGNRLSPEEVSALGKPSVAGLRFTKDGYMVTSDGTVWKREGGRHVKVDASVVRAATGYEGMVHRPTLFLTGEGGESEHVKITPIKSAKSHMGGDMSVAVEVNNGITINVPPGTQVDEDMLARQTAKYAEATVLNSLRHGKIRTEIQRIQGRR